MSFILDALKKLEHKRQQESVPDLMTVHSPQPQKRSILPYLIAAALILNAGILMAWLRPWDKEEPPIIAKSDTMQSETTSAAQSGKENITPEPETAEAKQSADTDENPPQDAPVKTVNNEVPELTPKDNKVTSLKINPSAEELEMLRNKIKEEQLSVTSYTPDEPAPAAETIQKSDAKVLDLSQLPSSVRDELPQLTISGHVFSNNPSSRIANINGSIVREGDNVTSGLKVKEITMTGVIFDYQGIRFNVRAF